MIFTTYFTLLFFCKAGLAYDLDRDYVALLRKHIDKEHQDTVANILKIVQHSNNTELAQAGAKELQARLLESARTSVAKELLQLLYQLDVTPGGKKDEGFANLAFDGHGDKYRATLSMVLQSRKAKHESRFVDHVEGWKAFEAIGTNIKFTQQALALVDSRTQLSKGLESLGKVVASERLTYENTMGEYSKQDHFAVDCMMQTLGCIRIKTPEANEPKNCLLNQDMIEVLVAMDRNIAQQVLYEINQPHNLHILESVLKFIADPLKRSIFIKAYEHWHDFEDGILERGEYDDTFKIDDHIFGMRKLDPMHIYLSLRMAILKKAMESVFILDNVRTSRALLDSWNLAQYLKYMSRLVPDMSLRQELENIVQEFLERTGNFLLAVRNLIKPQYSCMLTAGTRLLNHPDGPIIKTAYFVGVPLPFHQIALVKGGPNNFSLFTYLDKQEAEILFFLSESYFSSNLNFSKAKKELLEKYCTAQ